MRSSVRAPLMIAVAAALAVGAGVPAASAVSPQGLPGHAPDPGVVGVTAGHGSMLVAGTDTPFVPYGFSSISLVLPGSYASTYCVGNGNAPAEAPVEQYWAASNTNIDRELLAMKTHWHANTIRLQVSQIGLSEDNQTGATAYTDLIRDAIQQARDMGLLVIVSLQTEAPSCTPDRPGTTKLVRIPDSDSVDAWTQIAPVFGHDRGVLFELFNEPSSRAECTDGGGWTEWADGCADGNGIGMVNLGKAVRAMAPDNVLIYDGDPSATTFAGFTPPADMTDNSAYAVHPYAYFQGGWDDLFGNLQASGNTVIVTEWNESSNCSQPPTLGPEFIGDYLPSHDIGLMVQSWDAPWNQLVGPDSGDGPADSNTACAAFTGATTAYDQFWSAAGNRNAAPDVHVSGVTLAGRTVDSVTVALADNGTMDCSTGPQVPGSVQLLVKDARTHRVEPITTLHLTAGTPWTCGSYTIATGSDLHVLRHRAAVGDTLIVRVHYAGARASHDTDYVVGTHAG